MKKCFYNFNNTFFYSLIINKNILKANRFCISQENAYVLYHPYFFMVIVFVQLFKCNPKSQNIALGKYNPFLSIFTSKPAEWLIGGI